MSFYIGNFSKPIDPVKIIRIQDPKDTETIQIGDIVERWDNIFEWDDHCLRASQLETWRATGDPLCDAALRSMFHNASSSTGVDLLERLQSDAALEPGGPSWKLLDEVSHLPPSDLAASPEELQEGQDFFLSNSVAIMLALLHFSLAGGFASPRITRVLQSVSYLIPSTRKGSVQSQTGGITSEMKDRTYIRLLETFQFVLDVMGCTKPPVLPLEAKDPTNPVTSCLEPGGVGWKSVLRVRLLHGIARRRIIDQLDRQEYSVDRDGIPINQEDMVATLGAFGVAPLLCLSRLYTLPIPPPTPSQSSAFIAIWRQVGFYLGIDQTILRHYFTCPHAAQKLLASTAVHLLTSHSYLSKQLSPTIPILLAVSNRPPFPSSFEHNCALTRRVLGSSLASHLGVPHTPLRTELKLRLTLLTSEIPVFFSHVYPRLRWSVTRRELTREALARVVRFQMGMRRTTFRARDEKGDLGPEVVALEAVKPDPVGGSRMVREYRALMLEMAIVMVTVVAFTLASIMCCIKLLSGHAYDSISH